MGEKNGLKKTVAGAVAILAIAIACWGLFLQPQSGSTQVTVVVPYVATSEWLPIYSAIEQGYYGNEGLNVTIVYGDSAFAPINPVVAGNAQFGFTQGDSVILARSQGLPVVSIYQVDHESSWGIIVRNDSGIRDLPGLAGKTMVVSGPGSSPDIVARAMFKHDGVENVNIVSVGQLMVPTFLEGKADAMPAHIMFEEILKAQGIGYTVFRAKDYDANYLTGVLVASEDTIAKNPELVRKFVRATGRGLDYAVKNQAAAVADYIQKYNPEAAKLGDYEANYWRRYVAECVLPDKYPLGYFDSQKWESTQDALYGAGIIGKKTDLTAAYTTQFAG